MIELAEVDPIDLDHPQMIADKLREGAGLLIHMPETANALNLAADQIETLCDTVKAYHDALVAIREVIIKFAEDDG